MPVKVVLGKDILEANRKKAADLRHYYAQNNVRVINILSSPGAGKTTLLQKTIPILEKQGIRSAVIEGDVATAQDAERLAPLGIPVVQITTMGACHLDSSMVWKALGEMDLSNIDVLFIENVGNLVCPASFDLGEDLRIVVLSVTEGSDKPSKYPAAFMSAQGFVINKLDILPFTDFRMDIVEREIRSMVPSASIFQVSARTGDGLEEWSAFLKDAISKPGTYFNPKGAGLRDS